MKSVKAIAAGCAPSGLCLAATLPLCARCARAADAAAQLGPQELVTKVAQDTLQGSRRAPRVQAEPEAVRELVDKYMLPHFDTAYSAQLVLGKYWRTATADQRKRFVEAFYQSLLQNYGDALLEFTRDRMKILPFQGKPDDTVATVRTEVKRSNGSACRSTTRCARRRRAGRRRTCRSKASYVKTFRTDFGSEIHQKGLEP